MTRAQPKLRAVPAVEEPAPDTSYESEHRKRILSRDWSKVHVEADRRSPFATVLEKFR